MGCATCSARNQTSRSPAKPEMAGRRKTSSPPPARTCCCSTCTCPDLTGTPCSPHYTTRRTGLRSSCSPPPLTTSTSSAPCTPARPPTCSKPPRPSTSAPPAAAAGPATAAHAARTRSTPADRPRSQQPADRPGPGDRRADRQDPRPQHPHQTRPARPRPGGDLRPPPPSRQPRAPTVTVWGSRILELRIRESRATGIPAPSVRTRRPLRGKGGEALVALLPELLARAGSRSAIEHVRNFPGIVIDVELWIMREAAGHRVDGRTDRDRHHLRVEVVSELTRSLKAREQVVQYLDCSLDVCVAVEAASELGDRVDGGLDDLGPACGLDEGASLPAFGDACA